MKKENIEDVYKLSPTQEGMLFHILEAPETGAYFQQVRCDLGGALDLKTFEQAWQRVLVRHPVLRTAFYWKEAKRPLQVVYRTGRVPFESDDWRQLPAAEQERRLEQVLEEDRRRGFELNQVPLMRVRVFRLADEVHHFLWSHHHLILDGWSLPLVLKEVFTLYEALRRGVDAQLPSPRPYRDYIAWLEGWDAEATEEAWREALRGYKPTRIEDDRQRSIAGEGVRRQDLLLSAPETAALSDLARVSRLTLNSILQGLWALLLSRYTGQDRVLFGATLSGRPSELSGVESMVGLFINTVPLAVRVEAGESLRQWLVGLQSRQIRLRRHQHTPLARIQKWSDAPAGEPLFESILVFENYPVDRSLAHTDNGLRVLSADAVEITNYPLCLLVGAGEQMSLSLIHRYDRFAPTTARRMLEHLRTLLRALVEDPEGRVDGLSMLTPPEVHQLCREWNDTAAETAAETAGDATFQDLFAEQAMRTPDAVAAFDEGGLLTYRDLHQRSNGMARRLAEAGCRRGRVVAILAPRGLDFLATILAVFKAGGAYLPLDPAHPPERWKQILGQSRAILAVTSAELAGPLGAALETSADEPAAAPGPSPSPSPRLLAMDELVAAEASPQGPPHRGGGGDPAYVIYTSGSTGLPKGAMIEHRGMLNHQAAKIDDLGIGQQDTVAQNASQCFDISVWQFLAPLLVGGRVRIFSDEASHDALELIEGIEADAITLFECVPTMLRVMLEELNGRDRRPRLASLRWMIPTGEALSPELAREWLDSYPDVPLLNAYGPTECSDDIAHYRIDRPPGPEVFNMPIGRPIRNLRLFVLDRRLQPVPCGVSGELYADGIGLGPGYLNDAARTAAAFVPNPLAGEPGARLYKTGDLASYLPDGNLVFLGRRDHQVKIRGFRIELGEIETVLLASPEVREAVVVAREGGPNRAQRLVAYVAPHGGAGADLSAVRTALEERLPPYMVPADWVALDALPLTANGKIDRKALPDSTGPGSSPADLQTAFEMPRNPNEAKLAEVWSEVLRLEQVGIHDNFFEVGGDSILGIQIVARAHRQGLHITPRQIFEHPTIAELAGLATEAPRVRAEQGPVTGDLPLTPIQRWFFEQEFVDSRHWNQAVLLALRPEAAPGLLHQSLPHLLRHHDALRLRFVESEAGWQQTLPPPDDAVPALHLDLSRLRPADRLRALEAAAERVQGSLDLIRGPVLRLATFDLGEDEAGVVSRRLLIAVHHLAMDGVSWRILLEDLQTVYEQLAAPAPVRLPAKTTSFRRWAELLTDHAAGEAPTAERDWWLAQGGVEVPGAEGSAATIADLREISVTFEVEETEALLKRAPKAYRTQIDDLLLTALARAFAGVTDRRQMKIDLEGHGREDLFDEADLSRTIGWFTALYPVVLQVDPDAAPGEALKAVKEQLRAVPGQGIGYGLLRYLGDEAGARELGEQRPAGVLFNYLGQVDQVFPEDSLFAQAREPGGRARSPRGRPSHPLIIDAVVLDDALRMSWVFAEDVYPEADVQRLAAEFQRALRELVEHCCSEEAGGYTPSDFPLATLTPSWLDRRSAAGRPIEDIYPLSPVQEGMFFHSLSDVESTIYFEQMGWKIRGGLNIAFFRRAWENVIAHYPVLRTAFFWEGLNEPVQVVYESVELPWQELDWSALAPADYPRHLQEFLAADRRRGFRFSEPPLLRLTLIRLGEDHYQVVQSHHHALMDGWSFQSLLEKLFTSYAALLKGREMPRESVRGYRHYIAWLQDQELDEAESFWRDLLAGFTVPTPLNVDRPGNKAMEGLDAYSERYLQLPAETSRALDGWARRHRLTLNTVMQGAWALLLSHYSLERDIVYGSTVAGRPPTLPGVEAMVGLFINTLPVRIGVSMDESLESWLRALQVQQARQRQYEHTPLSQVRRWSQVPGGEELFSTILVFENYPLEESLPQVAAAFQIEDVFAFHRASYPIALVVVPGERMSFRLAFDQRRLDPLTIDRLLGHLQTLLKNLGEGDAQRAGELSLLTPAERHQALVEWSSTATEGEAPVTLGELFEDQVERNPEAVAVVFEGAPEGAVEGAGESSRTLTYAQLNRRANRLAHHLRSLGVGPETAVGICSHRSPELVVGLVAILKAGGFFVPIDPTYPAQRKHYMLESARASVMLVESRALTDDLDPQAWPTLFLDDLPEAVAECPDTNPHRRITPDNSLYAIFTSGSTGRPKGVLVEHRHLLSHLRGIFASLELPEGTSMATVSTISADVGNTPIFGALCSGGCLHVISEQRSTSPEGLSEYIRRHDLDFLKIVPSHLNALRQAATDRFTLPRRRMLNGGETYFWRDARELQALAPELGIFNHYGPTETTVGVMTYRLRVEDQERLPLATQWLPLGRPLVGARVFVLDLRGRPVPIGVPGQIWIGGASVSRGYLHQPRMTAERFRPDPFSGEAGARLYKTGDVASLLPEGQLEFLGRTDHQIKVRGFRVELEEIQGVLRNYPTVQNAAVVARGDSVAETRLVAYVAVNGAEAEEATTAEDLRQYLAAALPDHMVPGSFVLLDALPLTANGKIDRAALVDPGPLATEAEAHVAPRNALEATLVDLYSRVLDVDEVSVEADYFDLGGNSLTAIRILAQIRQAFSVEIATRRFFEAGTVGELALVIEEARSEGGAADYAGVADLSKEVVLDPAISASPDAAPGQQEDPAAVLLTGATGFVGAYLLHELLQQTRAKVYCLVRARNDQEAGQRVRRHLAEYELLEGDLGSRIVPLCGDLSRPMLGLDPDRFAQLADELDGIYHNGALVNFAYPYPALKRPNVLGTEEVLRLAAQGAKVQPVHYVSTTTVFESAAFADRQTLTEEDEPHDHRDLPDGYAQSKWVAERLVQLAASRGVPTSIFRLGRVSWHSQSGVWAESDFVNRLIKSCIQLGGAPKLDRRTPLTPVDYVSRALVALSLRPESLGQAFHLTNADPVPWSRLVQWIEARGYPVERWSPGQWQARLRESLEASPDNALYPLAALAAGDAQAEQQPDHQQTNHQQTNHQQTNQQLQTLEADGPIVQCPQTAERLEALGIPFPAIDAAVVDAYFSRAQEAQTLPQPAGEALSMAPDGPENP